uniref:Mitochondrial inner membrane protease subunit, putative n=1 Tax=Arundo donax TaxID=35708 RepID=A0A0A9C7G4_ARUDO
MVTRHVYLVNELSNRWNSAFRYLSLYLTNL